MGSRLVFGAHSEAIVDLGEAFAQGRHLAFDLRGVHAVEQHTSEARGDVLHLIWAHAMAGQFLLPKAQARR